VFVFYLIIITFSSIFCEQILSAHVGFDTFLQEQKHSGRTEKNKTFRHNSLYILDRTCVINIE